MGLTWLRTFEGSPRGRRIASVVYLTLAWLVGELDARSVYYTYKDQFRRSREFATVMVWGRWDDPSVDRNFFLAAARLIRERTNPDDQIVTSGHLSPLYLLSGRLPPSPYVVDLILMSCMEYPSRHPDAMEEIRRHPPRIVVEAMDAHVKLNDYWPDFQRRYRLLRKYPPRSLRDGAVLWELKEYTYHVSQE